MSNEKATLIIAITPNPNEMEAMQRYIKASGELSAQYGAQVVQRYNVSEQIAGDAPAALIGISEFPSADKVKAFFGSDEYAAMIPDRDKGFTALNIYMS